MKKMVETMRYFCKKCKKERIFFTIYDEQLDDRLGTLGDYRVIWVCSECGYTNLNDLDEFEFTDFMLAKYNNAKIMNVDLKEYQFKGIIIKLPFHREIRIGFWRNKK